VTAAPTFTNAGANDFTLAAGSSAINAGTNLGATYQFGIDPRTSFPWGTLNRNSQGSGWEIGAFVFVQQKFPGSADKAFGDGGMNLSPERSATSAEKRELVSGSRCRKQHDRGVTA